MRSCGTLLVLIAILLFGYSIVGMEIFGGMFYSCRYGKPAAAVGASYSPVVCFFAAYALRITQVSKRVKHVCFF